MAFTFAERVTFHTPETEDDGGVLRELSDKGAVLWTVESFGNGTPIELTVTLMMGKNPMVYTVSGTIDRPEPGARRPLRGYRVKFDPDIPTSTKRMLHDVAKPEKPEPEAPAAAPPQAPSPAAELWAKLVSVKTAPASHEPQVYARPAQEAPSAPCEPVKERRRRKGMPRGLITALSVSLALAAGFLSFQWMQKKRLVSQMPEGLAISSLEVNEGSLIATVGEGWIQKVGEARAREQLLALAALLQRKRYDSATFLGPDGKTVAQVILQRGAPLESARITLAGP